MVCMSLCNRLYQALLQQALSTIDNVMEAESGLEVRRRANLFNYILMQLWRNPGDTPAHVTTALAPPSSAPVASANVQEPKNIYGTEKVRVNIASITLTALLGQTELPILHQSWSMSFWRSLFTPTPHSFLLLNSHDSWNVLRHVTRWTAAIG